MLLTFLVPELTIVIPKISSENQDLPWIAVFFKNEVLGFKFCWDQNLVSFAWVLIFNYKSLAIYASYSLLEIKLILLGINEILGNYVVLTCMSSINWFFPVS